MVDLVVQESRGAVRRSDAIQISSIFLCMVPNGPSVGSKQFADDREWDRRNSIARERSGSDRKSRHSMIIRGRRSARQAFRGLGEISDLMLSLKKRSINESITKGHPLVAPDLPIHIYTDSLMVNAMTKRRTENKQ
jgi:hypothetical protein